MKHFTILAATALAAATTIALPAPAEAQTRAEQRRFDNARARFEAERNLFERERAIYDRARVRDRRQPWRDPRFDGPGGYPGGPVGPGVGPGGFPGGPGGYYDDGRFQTDYDAARYYRDDPRYTERVLGPDDQVFRGSDGRYYCRRQDGTTGLIIGGAIGGILGNVIDGGRNRAGGTLIGGALGALLGREVDRNNQQVRCR